MDERGLKLKKRILSRAVRCENMEVLSVVDLLLERGEAACEDPAGPELDAILGEVARALRGHGGATN